MNLKPYKFVVQAIVQSVDETGEVSGEIIGQAVEVFGLGELAQWAEDFPANLARESEQEEQST